MFPELYGTNRRAIREGRMDKVADFESDGSCGVGVAGTADRSKARSGVRGAMADLRPGRWMRLARVSLGVGRTGWARSHARMSQLPFSRGGLCENV